MEIVHHTLRLVHLVWSAIRTWGRSLSQVSLARRDPSHILQHQLGQIGRAAHLGSAPASISASSHLRTGSTNTTRRG